MVNKGLLCIIMLILAFNMNAQHKSVVVLFFVNEEKVENIDFYVVNEALKSVLKLKEAKGVYNIGEYLEGYDLYIKQGKNIVKLPKVDYLEEINYIEISHYSISNKKMFEKKYNKKYIRKGKSFQINFGLGDVFFINYSKQQMKRIKAMLNN